MRRPPLEDRVVRVRDLTELLGISRSTLWRWERGGLLPPKRRLGPNVVGWYEEEVQDWLRSRPSGLGVSPEDLLWKGATP
jgi:prophage regulatory protein